MISLIGQNVSFGTTPARKTTDSLVQTAAARKKGLGAAIHETKANCMNFVKGVNKVTSTTGGFSRGLVEGVAGASVVGLLGKNIKEHNGDIFKTLGGVIKDTAKETGRILKGIPAAITKKTPLETATSIVKEPFRLAKKLKGNPATIAIAAAVGLGILAVRTFQGSVQANKKNSDMDHALNEGHVPVK